MEGVGATTENISILSRPGDGKKGRKGVRCDDSKFWLAGWLVVTFGSPYHDSPRSLSSGGW